ncbi:MAG: HupE/UreJ family protein [Cyclobacteriaceae bacterium]|nr:HupE/UreJ family protein [Cyclobacteriaceae bacterium]
MSVFNIYFDLGLEHILALAGLDHIIFIIILCAIYLMSDWKKVLILVTAFTIGHTITLGLATFQVIKVNSSLVEFLIPLTIFITALSNIFLGDRSKMKVNVNYYLALFFGLIHGLGFSNSLRGLLGKNDDFAIKLLGFNLGLEVGQIVIVMAFLLVSFLFVDVFKASRRDWRLVISSLGAGIAILLMIQNKFW